ncbi:MAG TPA: protein kinase [Thermoanaerobaculia bacterium]|nr:protein kinase [Thermoanaerobaculia bacterium]
MDPERWRRLSELFAAAREQPEAIRAGFLDRACADDGTLRAEVDALLAQEAATGPLDRELTVAGAGAAEVPADELPLLAPGTRLGPYEVIGVLGSGGMGQVYRARDTRLAREVAIKRIRDPAAQPELRRRFEQEARAAGQLNHPNILAIYDVGTHEGQPYLVSELLTGETLRQRMAGKTLPWRRVVEIAGEICRGLAAAHAHGIVHRDLKPDNVFITRDGRVKLLDFGLAKLQTASEDATHTATGMVMGTVGYMAPEQVRGQAVDARADVFAVGTILYEMLAGAAAFRRGTAVETLAAILNDEPPDLGERRPDLPPALVRVVRHCLEKSPEARFQSAGDLAFQLAGLAAPSESMAAPAVAGAAARRRLPARAVLAAALAALLAGAAGWLLALRLHSPPVPTFRQLTYGHGSIDAARFARDGATVFYSAEWEGGPEQTFSMRLDTLHPQPIALPPGRLLAVARGELMMLLPRGGAQDGPAYLGGGGGVLASAPLEGGAPRELLEGITDADWSPEGDRLAVVRRTTGGTQLELPIGHVLYRSAGGIGSVRIAPDGNRVAFIAYRVVDDTRGAVAVADADGGGVHVLSPGWGDIAGLAWVPDGDEIWFTASHTGFLRALHAVDLRGNERVVASTTGTMELEDIAHDGRVLFAHVHRRSEARGTTPGDAHERDLSWFDWTHANDLSADGRQVLFTEEGSEAGPQMAVYLRSTSGYPSVRLGEGHATALSPDGRWAIAHLRVVPPPRLVLLPTGPGAPRPLPRGSIAELHWAWWFPDGRRLLVMGNEAGRPARLFVQDANGGLPAPLAAEGITTTGQDPISPDGRQIALDQPGAGTALARLLLPQGTLAPLAGTMPGDEPIRWSADGRWIYLKARAADATAAVVRVDVASGRREPWKELRPADSAGVEDIGDTLLTPDGASYVYTYHRSLTDLYLAEGLR